MDGSKQAMEEEIGVSKHNVEEKDTIIQEAPVATKPTLGYGSKQATEEENEVSTPDVETQTTSKNAEEQMLLHCKEDEGSKPDVEPDI